MSTKPHATRYPLKRETRIIDKGELGVIEVNLGLDLTEPNWADIEREVALLSPKGLDGQRARMDPYKVIAQAQHLAELYRQYGKPIPNDLAVLLRVRCSKIDLDHFNIPPDNGCWVHPKCLECPRETCIEDEPPVVKGRLPHMESVARRDAVLRRYVSGESVTAISKAMAVKYNTVASIISKARKRKEGCVSIIK